jgi:hypothetical protein
MASRKAGRFLMCFDTRAHQEIFSSFGAASAH